MKETDVRTMLATAALTQSTGRRFGSTLIVAIGLVFALTSLTPLRVAAADGSKGTAAYQGKTIELKYVYLVKGPDAMSNAIRELVFSPTDIGAKIQACASLGCVSGELKEGMTVDFDAGPRLNYWIVTNGQRVQYSGTAEPSSFTASANEANRLAGALKIDDAGAGGGKVDVTFDAGLAKDFGSAH
jgi:hypothetical protein